MDHKELLKEIDNHILMIERTGFGKYVGNENRITGIVEGLEIAKEIIEEFVDNE